MKNDPDILVELMTTATDFDAEVVAAALREEGIPRDGLCASNIGAAGAGVAAAVDLGIGSRADLERAKSVLIEIRKAALNLIVTGRHRRPDAGE